MMNPTAVLLSPSVEKEIRSWSEAAYPHEGCGVLIGEFVGTTKKIVQLRPLRNLALIDASKTSEVASDSRFITLPEQRRGHGGKTEFVMDPAEFNRAALEAAARNMDIVGIIHTHPDHPPMPSPIDASQPFLAQWSNIIVAVHKGRFVGMKSWYRDDDSLPFDEEPIQIL